MFTPLFLSTTDLGTIQLISHLAQHLFQSTTLTATEMPVAANCGTLNILALFFLLFTLQCNVLGQRMGWLENTGERLPVTMETCIYTHTHGLSPANNSI